jgi:hypothetical protein
MHLIRSEPEMISRRFIFLMLLIVNLLCAQQIGLAHMVGHTGDHHQNASELSIDGEDVGHGELESLPHVCSICAALAGFFLPLNQCSPDFFDSGEDVALLVDRDIFPPSLTTTFHFQSRAPPSLQS